MLGRRSTKLSKADEELLRNLMAGELHERPPTIGVVGPSGSGKSSTINRLFRSTLATSDTVACTKQFWAVDVDVELSPERLRELVPAVEEQLTSTPASLRVFDAPGLGEDLERDREYLAAYDEHLEKCDVILWIMTARNRAVALDQQYLARLGRFHKRFVFAINQVDLVEPMDWHPVLNAPSARQAENIAAIVSDRRDKVRAILQRDTPMVAYSARKRYNLQPLFETLLSRSPHDRRWAFSLLKGFRWDDFLTVEARRHLDGRLTTDNTVTTT